jgi:hypothetical protein
MAVRRAIHIVRQICRAVAAAHEVGIIHRDLKSDNIVLVGRGKDPDFVKVLDFGICKTINADSSTTSPGLVMGSPDYMAPEQGAGLDATVASDIYSVGCIVYEMLAGVVPFTGRNAIDVLMQKGSRDAPRITEHRSEVPAALAEVVARCLMRNPGDRPPSMRALEYELTRAVDGRAQAVAAVLGLNMSRDPGAREEPSPAASASFHRAAIASLDRSGLPAGYQPREHTAVAPAPTGPADSVHGAALNFGVSGPVPTVSASASSSQAGVATGGAGAAAAKALLFVVLGGALAAAAMYTLRDRTDAGEAAAGGRNAPYAEAGEAEDEGGEGGVPMPAVDGETDADVDDGEADPTKEDPGETGDEPTIVEDDPTQSSPKSAADLATQAEAALAEGHFSDPVEGSLAMSLQHLGLVDPSHEAIGRLRREAAKTLMPVAEKAAEDKQWTDAAKAYRDLVRVWPDHLEARDGLVEALRNSGRVLSKHDDHAETLAAADEWLNYSPEELDAWLLRAEALEGLERWIEARDAYREARKIKPRDKRVKKGMRRVARRAKTLEAG